MARYRRSRSSGRRRSGGGRRRGSSGRFVSSGGGGGSRSGGISGKTLAMIAGGGLVAFLLYKHMGTGVHPAVAAAAAAPNPYAAIDAAAAAGSQTDFNSMTNIGLPIPYNPGAGMQSGPLQN